MGTESEYKDLSKNTSTAIISKVNKSSSSSTFGYSTQSASNSISNEKDTFNGSTVPFIPVFIDEHNVIAGAKHILKLIRPEWDTNAVHFKNFTDGITNKLVGCFYKQRESDKTSMDIKENDNGRSNLKHTLVTPLDSGKAFPHTKTNYFSQSSEVDNYSNTAAFPPSQFANNVVLVRVYGNNTDLLIDRKAETRNILLLHSYGFAPSLYATFENGLAYDYVPGVTLNTSNVLQPEVWHLVARRMAEMHREVKLRTESQEPLVPMLWKKTQSFFDLVPETYSDPNKHERLADIFLPIARMRQEFKLLYQHLSTLSSPIVFAHNDLLLGNVVYMESQKMVNFIDYEYADYNHQAFDIGNHFAEFAGVDEVDYNRYPKREFQYEWLRVYLQVYLERVQISDIEVHRLYVQVNQFALAAHLFWTIWSLIQAEHSTIDFDYINYAFTRYNEYLARKDEFLALEADDLSSSLL